MPGAQCTRSLVCAGGSKYAHQYSQRRAPETSGIPHAIVLRFIRVLPGDRAFLPPSPRGLSSAKLDTSVGVSGPHDFAVRLGAVRYRRLRVHRIPSRERDDRVSPLSWDGGINTADFTVSSSKISENRKQVPGRDPEHSPRSANCA
jgi:hypothetical protein